MKTKRIAILAGVLVSLTFVVYSVNFLVNKNRLVPPEEVLIRYMNYIETGNYEKMYDMLSKKSKEQITEKKFIERNENIYQGIKAKDIYIAINEKKSREDKVQYNVKMDTAVGGITYDNSTDFVREGRTYTLTWKDQTIFPWLTKEDKVVVTTLPAKRGVIYDRNGVILAGEGTVTSVGLVPGKRSEDTAQRMRDLKQLAEFLETTPESIEKKLKATWIKDDSFVPLKKLTRGDVSNEFRESLLAIPGVMVTDEAARVYPLAEKASHLVGYVQGINAEELEDLKEKGYDAKSVIGKSGLESLYEKRLKGKNGFNITIVDKEGKEKVILGMKAEEHGENIITTIDSNLQSQIYEQYKEVKSCSVAMNPLTGEVLALVNTPSYDNNDFILGMTEDYWETLNEDESRPLLNRFRQTYSPGSTIKPIVGAIGLDMGIVSTGEDLGNGEATWKKDESWGEYQVVATNTYEGPANLKNALVHSDNIYFAKVAIRTGPNGFTSGLSKFGFHQELPFAIRMKASQYGKNQKIESEMQLADSGYGKGKLMVNPVHMATMYTTFLNEGDLFMPYLEYRKDKTPKVWVDHVVSRETAQAIGNSLVEVVEDESGDSHGIYRADIKMAGKTGTAEREDLGWFVSYINDVDRVDNLLLLSVVEDIEELGGNDYIVGKEKNIFDAYLQKE